MYILLFLSLSLSYAYSLTQIHTYSRRRCKWTQADEKLSTHISANVYEFKHTMPVALVNQSAIAHANTIQLFAALEPPPGCGFDCQN